MHARPTLPFAILFSLAIATAHGQCPGEWRAGPGIPGIFGNATACTTWDPDGNGPLPAQLFVGGDFQVAGDQRCSHVAACDLATLQWSALGGGVQGPVSATLAMPATAVTGAGVAVAGSFRSAGGQAAHDVALWDGMAWRALGSWNGAPLTNSGMRALLALPNGELLAGGWFGAQGSEQAAIARWNGTAWTIEQTWGGGLTVTALAMRPNGDLLAAVDYATFGFVIGTIHHRPGPSGTPWVPFGSGLGARAVAALPSGQPIAAFGGAGVMVWNGSAWASLGTGLTALVHGLTVLPSGDVLAAAVGGLFHWNGATWTLLGPAGGNGTMRASTPLPGGSIVGVGWFDGQGGVRAGNVALWSGGGWQALGRGVGSPVHALVQSPSGAVLAGTVTGDVLVWTGTEWSGIGGTMDGEIEALAFGPAGELVAGGLFTTAGGAPAASIAQFTVSGWAPLGTGINGRVNALATLRNGDLVAAGWFSNAGGFAADKVARWDGTRWWPLGSGVVTSGSTVESAAVLDNGDLVIGGSFTFAGGTRADNIARWDGSAWHALGSGLQGLVYALLPLPGGGLIAGGTFVWAGNARVNGVARWDGNTWQPMGNGMGNAVPISRVRALTRLPSGDVLAGGQSQWVVGGPVGRFDGANWLPEYVLGAEVRALLSTREGEVVMGGDFSLAGNAASPYAAWQQSTCPASATVHGAGCAGGGGPLVLRADNLPWLGVPFSATVTGLGSGAVAFDVLGLAPLNLPLSQLHPASGAGCDLLVRPDASVLLLASAGGTASMVITVPPVAAVIGMELREQVVELVLGTGGALLRLASSNALVVRAGAF